MVHPSTEELLHHGEPQHGGAAPPWRAPAWSRRRCPSSTFLPELPSLTDPTGMVHSHPLAECCEHPQQPPPLGEHLPNTHGPRPWTALDRSSSRSPLEGGSRELRLEEPPPSHTDSCAGARQRSGQCRGVGSAGSTLPCPGLVFRRGCQGPRARSICQVLSHWSCLSAFG